MDPRRRHVPVVAALEEFIRSVIRDELNKTHPIRTAEGVRKAALEVEGARSSFLTQLVRYEP